MVLIFSREKVGVGVFVRHVGQDDQLDVLSRAHLNPIFSDR